MTDVYNRWGHVLFSLRSYGAGPHWQWCARGIVRQYVCSADSKRLDWEDVKRWNDVDQDWDVLASPSDDKLSADDIGRIFAVIDARMDVRAMLDRMDEEKGSK